MVDQRCCKLMKAMTEKPEYWTMKMLAEKIGVSQRAVRYDLDRVDEYLEDLGISLIQRKKGRGVKLSISEFERERLNRELDRIERSTYLFTAEERIYVMVDAFCKTPGYITLDQVSEILQVSVSTVKNDLRFVRHVFQQENVEIKFLQRSGLMLLGSEQNIRSAYVRLIRELVAEMLKVEKGIFVEKNDIDRKILAEEILDEEVIYFLQMLIRSIEQNIGVTYTDLVHLDWISQVYVAYVRDRAGYRLRYEETKSLHSSVEYEAVEYAAKIFKERFGHQWTSNESNEFVRCLLGASRSKVQVENGGNLIFHQLVTRELIEFVNREVQVEIANDQRLYKNLLKHVVPMVYRLRNQIAIDNPLLVQVKREYRSLYNIVEKACRALEIEIDTSFPTEEIVYLVLHFGAALERIKKKKPEKKKIMVVCHTGMGTSELLSAQIQSNFWVEIAGVHSLASFQRHQPFVGIDYILSTIPLESESEVPIYVVPPILKDKEIRFLADQLLRIQDTRVEMASLIQTIEQSCVIQNKEKLEADLRQLLEVGFIQTLKKETGAMLKDIISLETVSLQVEVDNWEEAVRKGGKLLEDQGIVTEEYSDAMVETVKNIGPYIVMEKGIAMPHARPERGAKKIGVSIMTLKDPVPFGNEENDPVFLVICFASTDSKSHLRALSDLMILFEDPESIEKIHQAKKSEEVLAIIEEICERGE